MTPIRNFLKLLNPKILTIILVSIITLFVFLKAGDYGLTWDIPVQEIYGKEVLRWYISIGKDQSFLNLGANLAQHGPFFEVIAVSIEHIFSPWANWIYTRAIVGGLTGVIGIILICLIGFEIEMPWVGFIASLSLALYPRYIGGMFFNSKDIPFAVSVLFIIWALMKLINNWNKKVLFYSIIFSISLGISISIRNISIVWYVILIILDIFWWILYRKKIKGRKKELLKHLKIGSIIFILSFIVTAITWPYIFVNPINNYIEAIKVSSSFPWIGNNIFEGKDILSNQLPIWFIPEWYLIGSPIITVLFGIVGSFIWLYNILVKRDIQAKKFGIIILFAIIYIMVLIKTNPILYDTYRHVFFFIPALVLVSAYGIFHIFIYLKRISNKKIKIGLIVSFIFIISLGYIAVIKEMIILHPYEYVYFNELVGGLNGAYGKYETDYWGACMKESADWLSLNYRSYTNTDKVRYFSTSDPGQISPYLSDNFVRDENNPDFYISFTRDHADKKFPDYKIIYTVQRDNTPLCIIKSKI